MSGVVDLLLEPLRYGFLLRALVAAVLVGTLCALVGSYVVLKGLAFIGDALAHVAFTGIVVAFLAGFSFYLGALAAAVAAGLGIGWVTRRVGLSTDTAIGIVFSGLFALGVVLMAIGIRTYTVDLFSYVFGDILAVRSRDLLAIGLAGAVVLVTMLLLYKELLFAHFDPVVAEAAGLPVGALQLLLLLLLSVTVVVSVQAVGVVLVLAMLVTPAATAALVARRMPSMMALAVVFGAVAAAVGFYLSYYLSVPSGGAIVLVATLFFALVAGVVRGRGAWRRLMAARS
ncbi:MAG: metal ABC transporter permease [Thermomicrobium sp.]|jgi:manganese/iron transport system permease protein|uniref:metal ABC transporter permease n=1 Tax=Thermomicrobium sp. TaxID=1969469 RepID=UPI001B1E24E8|nr:metal ABC transporter permease [Thermomicrobium sp.]MBO9360251.1 metal ABC transporter permease [Thermomicrobium sp.]